MTQTMRVGWLWLDASKQLTLEQKVTHAADRYRDKFGHKPNTCYVHRSAVDGELRIDGLRVAAAGHVLKHHFWLGVEKGG